MVPVVVYGGGGHSKVVIGIAQATRGVSIVGVLDDRLPPGTPAAGGLQVLGAMGWLRSVEGGGVAVVLAIGNTEVRARVAARCREAGAALYTLVHPSAVVSPSARLGAGTVVMPLAVINADAAIGEGAIINSGAVVEHDCIVGDFAHVSPNAALGGAAQLGARSHLGLGAVILPGVGVGADTVVGAGAVVARPLPSGVVAAGVPARIQRQV